MAKFPGIRVLYEFKHTEFLPCDSQGPGRHASKSKRFWMAERFCGYGCHLR
jgi:hypothetical protein